MTAVGKIPAEEERFSVALRALSWADHRRAESTGYIEDLMGGRLSREGYAALLGQLVFVYRLLEQAGEVMRDDPLAGPFVMDDLARTPALEADLAFLYGPGWSGRVAPVEATSRYVERLAAVAFSDPAAFVAHHYTRYLGDLSGGLVIGRAARRIYGFDERGGAGFYSFPTSVDPTEVKARYRDLLDSTAWSDDDRRRLADEVVVAYGLNTDVLAELGHGAPAALEG